MAEKSKSDKICSFFPKWPKYAEQKGHRIRNQCRLKRPDTKRHEFWTVNI